MNKIVLLKMGDLNKYSHPDYDKLIIPPTGVKEDQFQICNIPAGDKLPAPDTIRGVIISGSGLMLTEDLRWKEPVCNWILNIVYSDKPVLGICFGHQLLAYALGGEIGNNPLGIELGTKKVNLNETGKRDILLGKLPVQFSVQESHVQSVLKTPDNAVILASNLHDPVQAFRYGNYVWGVQFHPEFDPAILRKIIRNKVQQTKFKIDELKLLQELQETEQSRSILKNFGGLFTDLL